jgi:hypothetical protein
MSQTNNVAEPIKSNTEEMWADIQGQPWGVTAAVGGAFAELEALNKSTAQLTGGDLWPILWKVIVAAREAEREHIRIFPELVGAKFVR